MEWICSKCKTKNINTNICTKCGFDESRNYARYATIAVLQEKDKVDFRKMIFKGDNILMACPDIKFVFGHEMGRRKIKSIQIYNTLSELNGSAWDISAHQDGSVMAWVVEDKGGWKHLKLAAEGGIIANENCSGLFCFYDNVEYIEGLQYLNTENVTDMSKMFWGCGRLQKLDLSKFDTSNVIDMNNMFWGCGSLQNLDISQFDTSNAINMNNMFWGCESLQKLDLSKFDTSNVIGMNSMFSGCRRLRNMDISQFDTSNVTNMSYMFCDCESLQNLDLSNFDTKNVIDMSYMFYNCKNLQNLNVNSFNVENVMDMSNMFWNCEKFLKKQNVTDMKEIPTDLQELQCDNDTENVIDIDKQLFKEGNILMACWDFSLVFWKKMNRSEIRSIQIYNTLSAATKSAWDISVNKDRSMLAWVVKGQNGWKHLKLAAEGEIIASEDCSYMFSFYDKVEHIEGFQYLNTGNVTNMSCMFLNCKSLQKLDLSNFDTRNVTNMSYMFSNCRSLSKPDISSFDMSKVVDKEDMFKNCKE